MLTTRDVTESVFGNKNREWNKVEHLEQWRANWADCCNAKLQKKGLDDRIDHRTLEAQGIDREPTIHVGHCPARAVINEQIKKRNEARRPANVAENMNNLIDKYENLEKQLRETATKTREIKRLNYRIEDIRSRAIEITHKRNELAQALQAREKLKFWQSKKEMNSKIDNLTNFERNARDFFVQAFGIEFDNVSGEIEKLERQAEALKTEDTDREKLSAECGRIKTEYQRQLLTVQTRPDVREILVA